MSVLIPLEFELLPGALINVASICHAEVAHPPAGSHLAGRIHFIC